MAWKRVANYSVGYSIPKKQFSIYYELKGDGNAYQIFPDPEAFVILVEMFKTERTINLNTNGNYFVSGKKKLGK